MAILNANFKKDVLTYTNTINEIREVLIKKFKFYKNETGEIMEVVVSGPKLVFPARKINVLPYRGDNHFSK